MQERRQQILAPQIVVALRAPPVAAAAASAQHRQKNNSVGELQIIREAEHEDRNSYRGSTGKSCEEAEYEEAGGRFTRRLTTRMTWASTR